MNYKKLEKAAKLILEAIGEENTKHIDGLEDTPKRVAKAWMEMMSGYNNDSSKIIDKSFNMGDIERRHIELKDIPFYTFCEHHLLPFFGTVDITIITESNKVFGLSKFNRIVENESRKLQTQERLTSDIGKIIYSVLENGEVKVTSKARHMCVEMRGIKHANSITTIHWLKKF